VRIRNTEFTVGSLPVRIRNTEFTVGSVLVRIRNMEFTVGSVPVRIRKGRLSCFRFSRNSYLFGNVS